MNARFLLAVFDVVYLLALTAWIGGLSFFCFGVAPLLVPVLGAEAAAKFVRVLFPRCYAWGATAGAVALAALVCGALSYPEFRGPATALQSLLLLAGTLVMLYGGNTLTPALNAAADAGPPGAARLARLHRRSVRLNGLVLAVGLGLLVAFAARPAPRTAGIVEPSPAEKVRHLEQKLKRLDPSAGGRRKAEGGKKTRSNRICLIPPTSFLLHPSKGLAGAGPTAVDSGSSPLGWDRLPEGRDVRIGMSTVSKAATAMNAEPDAQPAPIRQRRSDRLLATLAPFSSVVLVSHVNPDPDALASMLGLEALLRHAQPGKPVTLTVDGMIARAENQAMVDLLQIPLVPIEGVRAEDGTAVVMVDSQPRTGRRASEETMPHVVLDHHETGGVLDGVLFRDIRPHLGATSTMVTGYLLEQDVAVSRRLATALLYGVESETEGYPREAGPPDDGALVWLFPRADKDLLARIRNPKLPQSYFATFQHALSNAFLYRDVVFCWCGAVPQPDIVAELADFFIRFDQVNWAVSIGLFNNVLKLSVRAGQIGGHSGELLRTVVNSLGTAGGHDKRAGGAIPVTDRSPAAIEALLRTIRCRFLKQLAIDEEQGHRLLESCPVIQAP